MSSIFDGYYSLGADINKPKGQDTSEDTATGIVGDFLPELTLDTSDADLIKLFKKRESKWLHSTVRATWLKQVEDNENYWKGKQHNKLETETLRPLVDNIVFQAVETYLPAANKTQPEPLVELRSTEKQTDDNVQFAEVIRDRLADWSEDVHLPQKMEKAGRNWLLSLIGIAKMSWDPKNLRPAIKTLRPKKVIFDPDGVTDEDGYSGSYLGEYRKLEASEILKTVEKAKPDAVDAVKNMCKGENDAVELGTEIQFIEWWTDDYICWILGETVLFKAKNIHFNWPDEGEVSKGEPEMPIAPGAPAEGSEVTMGEMANKPADLQTGEDTSTVEVQPQTGAGQAASPAPGAPVPGPALTPDMPPIPTAVGPTSASVPTGPNHFTSARKPYVFISIFNLGKTPVDETSLITQILPQQDLINKRERQLDKYAEGLNGGVVVSEERSGLTKEEAKSVTDALRRGGTVIVPAGSPQDAVYRLPSNPLPPDVYNNLVDNRNRVYDLFGIKGITPGGIQNEDTVRGKIITKGLDTDRIGGGITPYFEQFASDILNWVVQIMYVYDPIFAAHPGAKPPKLKVTIKPGSLLPKDATTKANQAIELANAGKMALVDLYKALEFSDPEKMAMNVWLEANAPELLFKDDPRFAEAQALIQQKQQAMAAAASAGKGGAKGPSESINFKDLPPEGKAQMAAQAHIKLDPGAVVAHEEAQKTPAAPGGGRSLLDQVPTSQ